MADDFEAIAQSVITGLNNLFKVQHPEQVVPARGAPPAPLLPPAAVAPAAPTAKPAVIVPAPIIVKPGQWTLAQMTAEILRNEGGFVDDPQDSGGVTNYGISVNFAKDHPEFFDFDKDHDVDREDIRKITPQQAADAYIRYFFVPAHFDKLPNVSNIMFQAFDMAVNMGVRYRDGESQATKCIQHAVGAPVDGVLGDQTLLYLKSKIGEVGVIAANNLIVDARDHFYEQVVVAHPHDAKFLPGWKKRAERYRAH